jgi:hypothetical protein
MVREKTCILIVDDASENIDILRSILGDEYRIKVALNGKKALDLAKKDPKPDLILLDVMMPEMEVSPEIGFWIAVAVAGGLAGSYSGSFRFSSNHLKVLVTAVLIVASIKLCLL